MNYYYSVLVLVAIVSLIPSNAMAKSSAKLPRSEIVPYDEWNCGASDFEKPLSHQLAQGDCPKRMFEADLCCRVHDMCYMEEHKSREDCDEAFCYCLNRTVAQPVAGDGANQTVPAGCRSVSTSFCDIVKLFGEFAHASSRTLREKQKKAMEALEQAQKEKEAEARTKTTQRTSSSSTTTTTPIPSTLSPSAPTVPSTTISPADIGQFVTHKFPLDCFDDTLSACTRQLHQCVSDRFRNGSSTDFQTGGDALLLGVQAAECSAQFCECNSEESARARQASVPRWMLAGDACMQSLQRICTQFQPKTDRQQNNPMTTVHFWSVNINYFSPSATLGLAFIGTLLLLLFLVLLGLLCSRGILALRERFQASRKSYAKSSIRRNTLTALRSVSGGETKHGGPHYMPFGCGGAKESTVSSPSGDEQSVTQHLLCPHKHHKKTHSEGDTHKMPKPLTLNSSQVHLIAGSSANSSSTLSSDISGSP